MKTLTGTYQPHHRKDMTCTNMPAEQADELRYSRAALAACLAEKAGMVADSKGGHWDLKSIEKVDQAIATWKHRIGFLSNEDNA